MPSTLKDGSPLSPKDAERAPEIAPKGGEAQPVALEVPVTVNGARAVEGSEKREPFSENTSTVLVRANGAVIRLSSAVAPGQLLFLTNEKTRKEVVCQVVKSKGQGSASGYVELEFTQPVLGFWGMRFPGERNAPLNTALPAARKVDPATVTPEIAPQTVEAKPASFADTRPTAENFTANLADEVQEFKTEIKADSRPSSKADFLAPNAEPSIDGLKLEANRLQEQLSALLFAENQSEAKPANSVVPPSKQDLGDAASKIFEMANEAPAPVVVEATPAARETIEPAPASSAPKSTPVKSSFDDEEVQIPAWLAPVARNAAIPAPPSEEVESDSAANLAEGQAPEAALTSSAAKQTASAPTPTPKAKSAAVTPRSVPAVAVFGNSLLGEAPATPAKPRGSGKGIWRAVAAALIVAAAGGGWYFRDSLGSLVAARAPGSNASPVSESSAALPVATPAVHSAALEPAPLAAPAMPDISASSTERKANAGHTSADAPAPVSSSSSGKVQTAAITERVPKSSASGDVSSVPDSLDPMEPEIKRSLGKVRLAKPKVRHSVSAVNRDMEPSLEASDALFGGDNAALGGDLLESSKQPAAPAVSTPVGGDVRPARMISSVPPAYPSLAKTQHVGGDVRIDALIDANGRVTTMKVVSGPSLLHQAAMDALRQWKYQPAMLDGKPVPMHLTVTIVFRLQ
jgi:protein TonB